HGTCMIVMILIGASIFGYFFTLTHVTQDLVAWIGSLPTSRWVIITLILCGYIVLGSFMDQIAILVLTVPIVIPLIKTLGFDPIWFGVIIVMTVELGLIHPPVGMNVFVIKSVIKDVNMSTIFVGVLPFVITDLIRLVILILFPLLATWLPQQMLG
ncbi:TRAP transporter large permease subunit, partial [Klebsiella pneumoniae]|uniref:TRAP transporter large permease subunit n=1 Tax=Klebsiella pneumoniae TaxID=573 RepID=UPI00371A3145